MTYFQVHIGCPGFRSKERAGWHGLNGFGEMSGGMDVARHGIIICEVPHMQYQAWHHRAQAADSMPKWAPSFRQAWTQSWGTRVEYAEQWYDNASPEDMHHVACLRVPSSFYDQLP